MNGWPLCLQLKLLLPLSAYRNSNNFSRKYILSLCSVQSKKILHLCGFVFVFPLRPHHSLSILLFFSSILLVLARNAINKFLHCMHVQHKNFIRFLSIFFSVGSIQKRYLSTVFSSYIFFRFCFSIISLSLWMDVAAHRAYMDSTAYQSTLIV